MEMTTDPQMGTTKGERKEKVSGFSYVLDDCIVFFILSVRSVFAFSRSLINLCCFFFLEPPYKFLCRFSLR